MPSACSTSCSSAAVGSRRSSHSAAAGSAAAGSAAPGAGSCRTRPPGPGTKMFSTRRARPARAGSVAALGRDQVVDEVDELGLAAGLDHVGGVAAVHDDERHALDVVALRGLLGALQ